MKRFNTPFLLIACVGLLFVFCESSQSQQTPDISLEETRRILSTLAADAMLGRDSRSGGYFKAAEFVTAYFDQHNIQPFYPAYRDSLFTDGLLSYNLVGSIGDYDPQRKTILIGAHLDHVGIQGATADSLYNGANDNATGSTAALQVAAYLATKPWKHNLLVALFSEEEKGLKGAYHLADRMKQEGVQLDYVVNFEMLGTPLSSGENQVYITGYSLSNMAEAMNAITPNFVQFFPQAKELNLFRRSDNLPFYEAFNVPAQTLSTFDFTNFDHYHLPSDEVQFIDMEHLNQLINTIANTLVGLLENESEIRLIEQEP